MKGKTLYILAIFMLGILAMTGIASALPTVEYLKIDGEKYESGDKLVVQLGEDIEIKVKLQAESGDEEDVEVEADIIGYEYNDHDEISDSTHTFDMEQNDTEYKELAVSIPKNAEKDEYDLRVRVAGRTGTSFEGLYRLKVEGARHNVEVKDIILSPEGKVKAGRALLGIVRIENYGEKDEESVKVKISIPELDLSASDYIDEIEAEEATTSEELYLRIPSCVDEGIYDVVAEVTYDEGYEVASKKTKIQIVEGDECEVSTGDDGDKEDKDQTIISLGSTSQEVTQGQGGAVYPITIKNNGKSSKSYVLSVNGADEWASTKISPSNTVVLAPGEMKAVYVYLTASENAAEGQRMFSVSVQSDSQKEDIPFTANVVKSEKSGNSWDSLKKGLVTGLVIIVVLLVLIGLIVGFNKLKGGDEDEDFDEEGKTYY